MKNWFEVDKQGLAQILERKGKEFATRTARRFGAAECGGRHRATHDWTRILLEFDAPGAGLVSYTSNGERLFANDGEFIQSAMPVLQAHGLTRFQHHPFTDVMALRQRFNFSCMNLSCGYHNWHRPDEYVVIEEVEAAIEAGAALIEALGCRSYPFVEGADDLAAPLFEITDLQLA